MAFDIMVWLEWIAIVVLVGFSGLFSGLNLGLMSLDTVGLEIVMAGDNANHVKAARKIKPLRDRGNWLLCTLLLGNVAVNAALSILLADKTDGLVGFILSTALIVVFGEIIPQATCSRYALEVGAKTVWIVWPLMFLMAVIAYPIAWILDKVLGEELGTIYSNKELCQLVDLTSKYRPNQMHVSMASMLKGALQLDVKSVADIYTEMHDVFWLNENEKLSFDVISKIFKLGHSRIPVFRVRDVDMFCIGLIYAKDLILVDPDDNIPITKVLKTFDHHPAPIDVWKEDNLQNVLQTFISTYQHLAFVKEKVSEFDDHVQYIGIITLEDVIEEILKTDLVDEYDKVDKSRSNPLKGVHSSQSLMNRSAGEDPPNKKRSRGFSVHSHKRGMIPVPVKMCITDPSAFMSSPNIMNKPFMRHTGEELSTTYTNRELLHPEVDTIKSMKLNKCDDESKYEDTHTQITERMRNYTENYDDANSNNDDNNKPQSRSTARIRTIPEIKSYLEHFIPKLSFSTTILCLFIKPLLIFLNVFFIVYMFYGSIFANHLTTSLGFEGHSWKKHAIYAIICIEFGGLMILFMSAIISYWRGHYAVSIDCMRWTGSWSIFQLFYKFQPLILIEYLSMIMNRCYDKENEAENEMKKWKQLRDDLKFEMKSKDRITIGYEDDNRNNELEAMKQCLSQLDILIHLHENHPSDLKNIKIIKELQQEHDDEVSINSLSTSWDDGNNNHDNHQNGAYEDDAPIGVQGTGVWSAGIHDGSTWLIFVFSLLVALCFGVLCLILKLTLFGFIVTLPIAQWELSFHWLVFMLFINQIWNMIDVDSVKLSTIYQFLFIDCSVKHSKYLSQRMSMLDNVIKEQLWASFKYRGFLLALSLNDEIVQKIIVSKSYDLSTVELIEYRKAIEKRVNKAVNKAVNTPRTVVSALRRRANWVEMVNEQQPYHPYVVVRQNIDKYYNRLDAQNCKILITIKYRHTMNYNEYKLAVKPLAHDGALYDDEVMSLYEENTLSRKSRTRSKQFRSSKRKREKNKLLLEMQRTKKSTLSENREQSYSYSYNENENEKRIIYKMHENTLLNEQILFDWILTHCHESKLTRWLNIMLITIGFVMTAMSILLYVNTNPARGQRHCDSAIIQTISIFDAIFFVFCGICFILVVIYSKLRSSNAHTVTKGMANVCCGILWLIATCICFIRFSYFFELSLQCQLFIVSHKTIFFMAVLSAGYLAFFMSFVMFTLLLHWISLYSEITWLLFMIFVFVCHFGLVTIFYVVGWNFVVHLVTQTIASLYFQVNQGDINKYCQVRFIFSVLMVLMIVIYLIIGVFEFYYLIVFQYPTARNLKDAKKGLLSKSKSHSHSHNQTKSTSHKYYDIDLNHALNSLPSAEDPKYIRLSRSRLLRKGFVSIFYFMAIVYTIIHDIINETSLSSDVHQECQDLDFGIAKSPIFYHNYSEHLFVFIMLIDLVLFAELFESYKIILDPFYCFAKQMWKATNNILFTVLSLVATAAFVAVVAVLFIKYDVGLL